MSQNRVTAVLRMGDNYYKVAQVDIDRLGDVMAEHGTAQDVALSRLFSSASMSQVEALLRAVDLFEKEPTEYGIMTFSTDCIL